MNTGLKHKGGVTGMSEPAQNELKEKRDNARTIRRHNIRTILELFRHSDTLTVQDITGPARLSKTSVIKILNTLLGDGILQTAGKGPSGEEGGKRPLQFALNAEFGYIITVILGTEHILCTFFNLKLLPVSSVSESVTPTLSYESTVVKIAGLIEAGRAQAGISSEKICGISVGCEGIISSDRGVLLHPVHHKWKNDLPLVQDLRTLLDFECPIVLDNDCRNLARMEMIARNDTQLSAAIIFTGYAIGGCIVNCGNILSGKNGLIGEFGHIVMEPESLLTCACGNNGCFEAVASSGRLLQLAYEAPETEKTTLRQKITTATLKTGDIFRAADTGDAFARKKLDIIIKYYSLFIHNVSLMHDIDTVIMQGDFATAGEYFLSQLKKRVNAYRFHRLRHELHISYSLLLDKGYQESAQKGGANLMLSRFMDGFSGMAP